MSRALIVCNIQNDFCSEGKAIIDVDGILPGKITQYIRDNRKTYDVFINTRIAFTHGFGVLQEGHNGAENHLDLVLPDTTIEFTSNEFTGDASAFDALSLQNEELGWLFNLKGVEEVDIIGLDFESYVQYTAIDCLGRGFKPSILVDYTVPYNKEAFTETCGRLNDAGVAIV